MHGKLVGLYVNTRRFRCRACALEEDNKTVSPATARDFWCAGPILVGGNLTKLTKNGVMDDEKWGKEANSDGIKPEIGQQSLKIKNA